MIDDRSVAISLGGEEYRLILTTRATMEIAEKYGGVDNFGDKLLTARDMETAMPELCWLVSVLANQGIALYNLKHPDNKKPDITADEVELLTTPADVFELRPAVLTAIKLGMTRNILSEDEGKNPQGE